MSSIKFKHVFAALMILSALSAFVIPARFTARAQPQVQGLFLPVAKPVRSMAGWVHERLARPQQIDARDARVLAEENDAIRQELAALSQALEEMRRRDAERSKLGPIRDDCTPVAVVGPDTSAGREGLLLRGSTLEGLKPGQHVLFAGGIVGTVDRAGLAGAEVRLVTDPGFRVGAYFGRFEKDESDGSIHFRRLDTPPALIEGVGDGAMRCATALTIADIESAGLRAGDWVVVEEHDWDARVQRRRLGKVVYIAPRRASPLYADIRIEPTANLSRLREVMVLTK